MKYTIFFAGLFLAVPVATAIATLSRRVRELVFAALVISTAFADKYDINFMSREWYRAMTEGFEVSFVDLLALVLLLSTLATMRREGFRPYWPASLGLMLAFLALCTFNVALSEPKLFGLFSLMVLVRGLIIFLAVAFHMRSERDVYILALALGAGILYQGGLAVMQRYLLGEYRVAGTFPHPNFLGNYCLMVAPILLAAVLSRTTLMFRAFSAISWAFCSVAILLTISRMNVALYVASALAVLMVGIGTRLDFSRLGLVLLISVAAAGMTYRASDGILERQEAMSSSSEGQFMGDRNENYTLAGTMAKDRPLLGVGLNNWSFWVSNKYGAATDKYGHPTGTYTDTSTPPEGTPAVFGHTIFGLTLAELGWPGLLLFLVLFAYWIAIAAGFLFTRRSDITSMLGKGCFFAFLLLLVSGLSESNFRAQYIFLLFNILVGFVAAMRHAQPFTRNANISNATSTYNHQ